MLVIAPLRVARTVWRQEAAKWSPFRHLTFSLVHGPKKLERLKEDVDIYLINPEGVEWLCQQFFGRPLPFDVVTVDELTKFKNHQSERSKALRPRLERVKFKWGLTGSLMPNGYMDLFGQQLLLDGGAALGRYITHFRDRYFSLDYDGFSYVLLPGAERKITERIAPTWFHIDENEYSQLPPIVPNPIEVDLDKPSRAAYERMKRDLIASLPGGVITAANAAASYSKMAQMANGAVYRADRTVEHLHDAKLDALEDLVEELAGEPLLIAYEFNHDLDRLKERFGKDLPCLGQGTTAAQEADYIARWNRNELPIMACHPASAGHGLNLQEGNAHNLAWFSVTWDFELYDQFMRRLCRSGNQAAQIFEHRLIARGTIDELKLAALRDKDLTQTRFLRALNSEILREGAGAHTGGDTTPADDRRLPLVQRLSRQAADAAPPAAAAARPTPAGWGAQPNHAAPPVQPQPQAEARPTPKGWGAPAGAETPAPPANDQRERIQDHINPANRETAVSAFSNATQDAHAAAAAFAADTVPPAAAPAAAALAAPAARPRTRGAAKTPETAPAPSGDVVEAALISARAAVLQIVFADPQTTLEEGVELAKDLMLFVSEG